MAMRLEDGRGWRQHGGRGVEARPLWGLDTFGASSRLGMVSPQTFVFCLQTLSR